MTKSFCDICEQPASDHEAILAAEIQPRRPANISMRNLSPYTIHARQYFTTNGSEDGPDLCDRCRAFLLRALADSIDGGPRIIQAQLDAGGLVSVPAG